MLVSDARPALRLRAAPELEYLGAQTFVLKELAEVERHLFAATEQRTVTRMLVVHFESFLPRVGSTYRYAAEQPRVIGGETYGTAESELDVAAEIAEAPQAEMARTTAFLDARGLRIPSPHAMARFARVVGDDRRSELLIFYHEVGAPIVGIVDRALAAFSLG